MKYAAAIFDMDGLLIDSEPLWQKAEKKVFATVGVTLTTGMCEQTMGMRLDEVVRYWYAFSPWNSRSLKDIEQEVLAEVAQLIDAEGTPMPGVNEALAFCTSKGMKLAVASSSYLELIEAVLHKLDIRNKFEVVHSAEFEKKGKPHPDIYLSTAKMLDVEPRNCIAFEDSYNGILSAKQAGMRTIAVPDPGHFNDAKFVIADMKIARLDLFNEARFSELL
jgi:HAD superfamily hydrolase (TIGR01509 family)